MRIPKAIMEYFKSPVSHHLSVNVFKILMEDYNTKAPARSGVPLFPGLSASFGFSSGPFLPLNDGV